ncbi:MAG TPA: hypothetical protein VHY76_09515, partial [Acetobacteraceae bacterium]|nr:hypothetical protein [Acetobacteraceae bacterium]
MADYYPLIARAIAGLDPSAPGESRRALYERARAALIAQLRSVEPPLSESEITRERLSLEEAVRKVESEAAQRARDASRSADAARGDRARAGDAFRATTRPPPRPGDAAAPPAAGQPSPPTARQPSASPPRPPGPSQPRNDRPPSGPEDQRPPRTLRIDPPPIPRSQPPAPPPDSQLPPTRERMGVARRGADNSAPQAQPPGIRGFRDIAADADDLGRAAAQATRAARKTYANVPSPSPEFDRSEPNMENRGADPEAPYSYDESAEEAERYTPPAANSRPRLSQDRDAKKRLRTGSVFPFKSAIAVGIVLILVGAGILWGKPLVATLSGLFKPSTAVVDAPKDNTSPPSKPKIPDRVGQPSSTDQVAPVAQKVVLYDEDPSDPKGKQYVGTVVWRTEPIKGGTGQPADISVRADIEIPERKFKMTM